MTDDISDDVGPWWRFPPLRQPLIAGLVALAGYLLGWMGWLPGMGETALYWLAIPLGAYHWVREGLEALLREGRVGIDILMLAATAGAGILGLWVEAAALVVLYGAAEGLEGHTYARTRNAIRSLLNLAPKEARVLRGEQEITIPAEELGIGDRFVVRPGEALPTDGRIQEGSSGMDESAVTGESMPVTKGPGEAVLAASINRDGRLVVEATAAHEDSTLARIIQLVEAAQAHKGRAQAWIERFGARYTPAVLVAAAGLLVVPAILGGGMDPWATRSVVLLVAAAPCALVISLPIAMAAGIGGAGRRGILIKGGAHLEHLAGARVVAFDKTGTLTRGEPAVTDVATWQQDREDFLAAVAGIESGSEHPLAQAIRAYCQGQGVTPKKAEDFRATAGSGVTATVEGTPWYMGSPEWLATQGVSLGPAREPVGRLQEAGKTVVLAGTGTGIRGLLALSDTVRDGAPELIRALHERGLKTAMLTGDNEQTARAMARTLGIDDIRAALKPADKVTTVGDLEATYGPALMVGDGVNDAPALANATCGIAMGAAGTDSAIEAADVVLMAETPGKVLEAIDLGKRAWRVSLQNIVLALAVLLVLIPAAVLGWLGVAITVVVHEASELLAVANGLRASGGNVFRGPVGGLPPLGSTVATSERSPSKGEEP